MPLPAPVTTTPAPLTDSIPASLHRWPWMQVCGLAIGLSYAPPPHGSQAGPGERTQPAPRVGGRGNCSSPGLVTVSFRVEPLAAAKIGGLIQSTPSVFRQFSGVGSPDNAKVLLW